MQSMSREKNPLNIFVMDNDHAKHNNVTAPVSKMNHQEHLERTNLMLEAENTQLKQGIHKLKKIVGCSPIGDSLIGLSDPNNQYSLQNRAEELQEENQHLKEALSHKDSEFKNKLFEIKLSYEANARKNAEFMQREMEFKYENQYNDKIAQLEERIKELERSRR